MKIKNSSALALTLLLGTVATNQAVAVDGHIWFGNEEGPLPEIIVGQNTPINLGVWMDFTADATLGGGVDFYIDNVDLVKYEDFEFAPSPPRPFLDPGFGARPGDNEENSFAFGNFAGITGPGTVANMTFMSQNMNGQTMISMMDSTGVAGGFFSSSTFNPQDVMYHGIQVNVVPEMETWAMMMAGMGFIGWRIRKMKKSDSTNEASALPA